MQPAKEGFQFITTIREECVVDCVETWFHRSRDDVALMRAVTTLTLTHGNGCCLFSDPNPLPTRDHLHNWHAFWNKSLGNRLRRA